MENYMQQVSKQYSHNTNLIKKLKQEENEYRNTSAKLHDFRDKLFMDIMLPIPSNNCPLAFMEGTAVHTNELLVPLGAKYFAKMTAKDAAEYCDRKSRDIQQKQEDIMKEQKLLLERASFMSTQNFGETEIVENYNEDEEKLWREKHKESIKKMKAQEAVERQETIKKSADCYFSRLEELEAEELEANEL